MSNCSFTKFRKQLHRHPELSNQENATARKVLDQFAAFAPDEVHHNLGGTGLAFIFKGAQSGPTTMLRCELDALPIHEINTFDHRSVHDGVSHKCGHDGHMAILTAVGARLAQQRPERGCVILLFQPAEETGAGAISVIEDPKFGALKPDYAFALHNIPGYPLGHAYVKSGHFNCASRGLIVSLLGKTSHAAHPENGISPALAISQLVAQFTTLPDCISEFSLVTVVAVTLGQLNELQEPAFGTSPGDARIMATLRTRSNETMDTLASLACELTRRCALEHGLSVEIEWQDIFHACSNTQNGYARVVTACDRLNIPCTTLTEPYRWSEDFGKLRDAAKEGAMFTLGSGVKLPQLHNPDYDFPDELIAIGSNIFIEIVGDINGFQTGQ
jgi:amidohydrolase